MTTFPPLRLTLVIDGGVGGGGVETTFKMPLVVNWDWSQYKPVPGEAGSITNDPEYPAASNNLNISPSAKGMLLTSETTSLPPKAMLEAPAIRSFVPLNLSV